MLNNCILFVLQKAKHLIEFSTRFGGCFVDSICSLLNMMYRLTFVSIANKIYDDNCCDNYQENKGKSPIYIIPGQQNLKEFLRSITCIKCFDGRITHRRCCVYPKCTSQESHNNLGRRSFTEIIYYFQRNCCIQITPKANVSFCLPVLIQEERRQKKYSKNNYAHYIQVSQVKK